MASSVVVNTDLVRILATGEGLELFTIAAATETAEVMIENISKTTGAGKAYKRNGRVHVASAPSQYPTKDTGKLKDSISIKFGRLNTGADIVIDNDYALDLEFGTSKMQSRPFIRRSVNEAMSTKLPEIFKRFTNLLNNSPGLFITLLNNYKNRRRRRSAP
jgi:hypothetical protein